ncbi:MAG: BspA family leucine-rich repeat surface protein, partial [Spirochaetota bacterium]
SVIVLVAPKLVDSSGMFEGAKLFDQPVVEWRTPRVRTTRNMFKGAAKFNQPPVVDKTDNSKNWVLPPTVEDTSGMFEGAGNFEQDLTSWDLPPQAKRENMFSGSKVIQTPKKLPQVGGKQITALGQPTGLTASEPTLGSLKLTWGKVENAVGYTLYYSTTEGFGLGDSGVVKKELAGLSLALTGLAAGTTYYFKVVAKGDPSKPDTHWDSPPSEEAKKKTLLRLAAPQLALSVDGAKITVTFPKVQGAASYTIEYSTAKDFRSDPKTVSVDQPDSDSSVSQEITGLSAKTTYHFRVTAKAAANREEYADSLPVVKSAVFRTLRFETKGGSAVATQVLLLGERAAKPTAPTKDGHTLYGWYEDEAYSKVFDFAAPVSKDRTLYAKWLDTRNYGITYSSPNSKTFWNNTNGGDSSKSITLTAENVPADITSELRSVTIDLTIAGNPGTAPVYAEKLKELAKDAAKYNSPVSLSNAGSGKAKVYAVVSRNFIRDAYGNYVGAGATRKEYYFLSRMIKNLTDLRLNTKKTNAGGSEVSGASLVKSGLIVPQDGNIRMRL